MAGHERMPAELATGRLVLSEALLRVTQPVPPHGKPDQVYELNDGSLVLVDTKRRVSGQVLWKDILQLSVYRVLLLFTDHPAVAGRSVRNYAWVRVVDWTERPHYVPVELFSTRAVVIAWIEHWRIPR